MWLRVIAARICCVVGVVKAIHVIWMVSELFYKQFAHEVGAGCYLWYLLVLHVFNHIPCRSTAVPMLATL